MEVNTICILPHVQCQHTACEYLPAALDEPSLNGSHESRHNRGLVVGLRPQPGIYLLICRINHDHKLVYCTVFLGSYPQDQQEDVPLFQHALGFLPSYNGRYLLAMEEGGDFGIRG